MNITIGNVVRGDSFFDRERLLEDLWAALATDSVLLAAPRRVGKTSIMHRLMDYPRSGFRVLFLDGQNYSKSEDLVADLVIKAGQILGDEKSIVRKVLCHVKENIDEIEIWKLRVQLRKEVSGRWREEGERAVRDALGDEGTVLIIIDELPILLHKMVQREDGKEDS